MACKALPLMIFVSVCLAITLCIGIALNASTTVFTVQAGGATIADVGLWSFCSRLGGNATCKSLSDVDGFEKPENLTTAEGLAVLATICSTIALMFTIAIMASIIKLKYSFAIAAPTVLLFIFLLGCSACTTSLVINKELDDHLGGDVEYAALVYLSWFATLMALVLSVITTLMAHCAKPVGLDFDEEPNIRSTELGFKRPSASGDDAGAVIHACCCLCCILLQ